MKNKILTSATTLGILIILVNIGVYAHTACAGYRECSPILPIPTDEYIGSPSATLIPETTCVPNDEWDRVDCGETPTVVETPTNTPTETPTEQVSDHRETSVNQEQKSVTSTPTPEVQVPMTGRGGDK